jgi:hypothetical protein
MTTLMDGNTDPQMVPVMGGSRSGSRSVFRGEEVRRCRSEKDGFVGEERESWGLNALLSC